MVRTILISLTIILHVSCQPKADETKSKNDSASHESKSVIPQAETEASTVPPEPHKATGESSPYVGEIDAFEETHEYYTTVYYRSDDSTADNYDYLAAKADSVIYEGDEMRRKRIPFDVAEEYFNITGLEKISVYSNGKHISEAELVRVELLEGMIESQFIAVFKPLDPSLFNPQVSYCISSGELTARRINAIWQSIEDSVFTKDLLRNLRLEPKPWNVIHIRTAPDNTTYSGVTYQFKAFLIETSNGQSTILKEIKEDYYIGAILPVHLEINGKPVLLLHMGVNETDMVWTSLAVFSGKTYEFLEGNRLKGRVYL